MIYSAHDSSDEWSYFGKSRARAVREAQEQAAHTGNPVEVFVNFVQRPSLDVLIEVMNKGAPRAFLWRKLYLVVHPVECFSNRTASSVVVVAEKS